MTLNRIKSLVFNESGKIVTDSITVAEVFEKNHADVMRDIRNQIEKLEEAGEQSFRVSNFAECDYINDSAKGINQNRRYPKFNLTEDGFVIVAMAYTTIEAMKMKVRFIEAFREMREQISNQMQVPTAKPQRDYLEIGQVTKLLNVLRVGLEANVLNETSSRAIRQQIAETITGERSWGTEENIKPLSTPAPESPPWENPDPQPQNGEWYLSTNIAKLAGVSVNMIGKLATKHNLRVPKYCSMRKADPTKRTGLTQVWYNEAGKNEFLRIIRRLKRSDRN